MTKIPSIARRSLAAAASFALILIGAGAAFGQTLPADPPAKLADFQGAWVGHSVPGSVDDRAATVNIQPLDSGGFIITWSSFEGESEGARRKVVTRERTMRFEPSGRGGVWRGAGSRDPVRGPASWARLHDRSLTVNLVEVTEDGQLEQQVYERTLTSRGLRLSYRRMLDGKVTRTLELEYLRL
ncbi:MAG TPA: hypothetical protein VJ924_05640 [Alphaproteobacteria bacterium]|nr:hypothetical protein [Alphaproteobacteria bacterium]